MKIYCSGIGGIGLSAYAAFQKKSGHTVGGSDRSDSTLLEKLRGQGIDIFLDQGGGHVPSDADLFVYSEAIPEDAPERRRAKECHIPQQSYFEALGDMTKPFRLIAVCGSHGKSSTTAMAAHVLKDLKKDPSVIVGTKVPSLDGSNWRKGEGDLFVVEACEYRRSFLHLSPSIILLTNVDLDHTDYYRSVQDYRDAFVSFLGKLPDHGIVITHLSDSECRNLASKSGKKVIDADTFPLPDLSVPGVHMRQNARLVTALASVLGCNGGEVAASLSSYAGCWRRMEKKGRMSSHALVFDDYAHHPTEIRATLAALRAAYPDRRFIVAFQPHMHNRTLKFYRDFVTSFSDADVVLIPNVYDARSDTETDRVDVSAFAAAIAEGSGVEARDTHSLSETEALLRDGFTRSDDIVVCMGAGDITNLAGRLVGN